MKLIIFSTFHPTIRPKNLNNKTLLSIHSTTPNKNALMDLTILLTQSPAQIQKILGDLYTIGLKPNPEKAFQHLLISANQDDPIGQYKLALQYLAKSDKSRVQWLPTPIDPLDVNLNLAVIWLTRSAKSNANAMYELSKYVPPEKESLSLLEKSAGHGHTLAMRELSKRYKKTDQAFKWLYLYVKSTPLSEIDPASLSELASLYYRGKGVEINKEESFYYLHVALSLGHTRALPVLAKMYYDGVGTEQNYEKAFYYYTLADTPYAKFKLSEMYNLGVGVEHDYLKSIHLLVDSAEKGHVDAQYQLGLKRFYSCVNLMKNARGYDRALNDILCAYLIFDAITWFTKAIESNHVDACVYLGLIFRLGYVEEDCDVAFVAWSKAKALTSKNERIDINYYLAECYRFGLGVEKDDNKAIPLYDLALSLLDTPGELERTTINEIGEGYINKQILRDYHVSPHEVRFWDAEPDEVINDQNRYLILAKYDNLSAQYMLSWTYWLQGNKKEATKWLHQTLTNDKDDSLDYMRNIMKDYEKEVILENLKL